MWAQLRCHLVYSVPLVDSVRHKMQPFACVVSIVKHGLISFSKNSNPAFVSDGFSNWKKAKENFSSHESSLAHKNKEAVMKWQSEGRPSLPEQFNTETLRLQHIRRNGLLTQLSGLRFLLQQGLALCGHKDIHANLFQLLQVWAGDSGPDVSDWLKHKQYMFADIVNEQITIMDQTVLRIFLRNLNETSPSWFAVFADEETDVANREQFNLSIRWVDDYNVLKILLVSSAFQIQLLIR